jgi:hypothetical protein
MPSSKIPSRAKAGQVAPLPPLSGVKSELKRELKRESNASCTSSGTDSSLSSFGSQDFSTWGSLEEVNADQLAQFCQMPVRKTTVESEPSTECSETAEKVQMLFPAEFEELFEEKRILEDSGPNRILVVERRATGASYVAKIQPKAKLRFGTVESVREISELMLALPDNKHVVNVHFVYEDAEHFYTLMDECAHGDLCAR